MATRLPEIGSDRAITVRLATGMTSRAVGFLASAVTMPDGENAIMLAVPAAQTGSRSAADIAARAISGFTEDGHFIAFVDAAGVVEAASRWFCGARHPAGDAGRACRRVARRTTASSSAWSRPRHEVLSGRLRPPDRTARHLLVVIDEEQLERCWTSMYRTGTCRKCRSPSLPSRNCSCCCECAGADRRRTATGRRLRPNPCRTCTPRRASGRNGRESCRCGRRRRFRRAERSRRLPRRMSRLSRPAALASTTIRILPKRPRRQETQGRPTWKRQPIPKRGGGDC